MLKQFYPDEYIKSAFDINYDKLFEEGYRGLLFDIDNTLVEHGADADRRAVSLINSLTKKGFSVCFISNNKEERVKRFNREIHADYIFKAGKPSKKAYLTAIKKTGTRKENTVFIGDQLFTDVWGAKRTGIRNILVRPIGKKEEIQIVLKRKLERIVLYFYQRKEGQK